ncbi:MAG: DHHA1 domain-containing protein [Candidatus Micrarchaeia archaeon]
MRLVVHGDFDGVVCAVLITSMEDVVEIVFAEPAEVQNREIEITAEDIIADLPYHPKCALWFDHHYTSRTNTKFEGSFKLAPSCARVVFDYYDNPYLEKYRPLVDAADKIDGGNITKEQLYNPDDYQKLSMTLDSDDPKKDDEYRLDVIKWLKKHSIEEIIGFPEVKRRYEAKHAMFERFKEEAKKRARMEGDIVIVDLRGVDRSVGVGSNYAVYAVFPECKSSIRIFESVDEKYVSISVGHNILKRSEGMANLGELMKRYGGGGHANVAGCRVEKEKADRTLAEIVAILREPTQ